MKRRTFFALLWASLAVLFGLLAIRPVLDGGRVVFGYGIVAVLYSGLAAHCQFYLTSLDDPNDPAPRRWFELAGVVAATLVIFIALLNRC